MNLFFNLYFSIFNLFRLVKITNPSFSFMRIFINLKENKKLRPSVFFTGALLYFHTVIVSGDFNGT
jgi:hypothetical protein